MAKDHEKNLSEINKTFADNLRRARVASGYKSAREFAEVLHLSESGYQNYESGDREPSFQMLETIAEKLDLDIGELFKPYSNFAPEFSRYLNSVLLQDEQVVYTDDCYVEIASDKYGKLEFTVQELQKIIDDGKGEIRNRLRKFLGELRYRVKYDDAQYENNLIFRVFAKTLGYDVATLDMEYVDSMVDAYYFASTPTDLFAFKYLTGVDPFVDDYQYEELMQALDVICEECMSKSAIEVYDTLPDTVKKILFTSPNRVIPWIEDYIAERFYFSYDKVKEEARKRDLPPSQILKNYLLTPYMYRIEDMYCLKLIHWGEPLELHDILSEEGLAIEGNLHVYF